jgi:WD40 repeat protein
MTIAQAADTVRRRGIGSLIEALRKKGFAVSTSEAIDATQLVVILARKEPEMDAARLSARLRPIFCKNFEQQKRFDAIFREWYGVVEQAPVVEVRGGVRMVLPPPEKPKWLVWIALGLILAGGAVFVVMMNREPRAPAPIAPTQTAVPEAVQPSGGNNSGITLPQQRTAVFGYFPRLRYNDELRPVWGWVLAASPLVALAGFSVPALIIARTRARRRSDPMYLDRRTLEGEARRIVPPLRADISGKLARHLRGSPEGAFRLTRRPILDVRGTIEKTLQNRGIPSPQFRHTHAPPSYLLLIDVANQRDPRGRLFYQWAERLQRERLDVDIALVRLNEQNQPQFRPTSRGEFPRDESGWLPLTRLPEPSFGQRLLLISTGKMLVDADGKWRAEAAAVRLHRWRQRAMFTPTEPRDWGRREEMIERSEHTADPGFLVLPLDENALGAWTDLLTTGQLSTVVLSEPQRYPALLRRGKADDFTRDEKPPDPPQLEKLIDQLRVYLGDLGFTWLAALAIPPLVRWELTVLLGRDVIEKLARLKPKDVDMVLARNYRRLVRLPWLRLETMPNWLRLRLIAELSTQRQNELRDLVEKLLGKLSPTPEKPDAIALEFERPPGRDATEPSRKAADDSDPLYLGYMSGLTPRQLAMRAPESWGRLIVALLPRERGLRGFLASIVDRARSWWARRVFLGGSPFRGLRGAPLVWAVMLFVVAAGFLTFVAKTERRWWPESIDPWLFTEEAHAIAFHHAGPVRTASFSPDGLRILTASDDGTARVWDVKTGKPVTPPLRHAGPVVDAKFSEDGDWVASASGNRARVWNARTGAPRSPWIEQQEPIREVELRGALLLTVGGEVARIWRLIGGGVGGPQIFQHGAEITHAAFGPDGRMLTAGRDGIARIWDMQGKTESLRRHGSQILTTDFGEDGTDVVIAGLGGVVDVWKTDGGAFSSTRLTRGSILHAEYDRRAKTVVIASTDGTARVWRLVLDDPRLVLKHADQVVQASFSSDNQRIVTASLDGTARVWDAFDGHPIGSPLRHDRGLTSAAFSADGMRIVTASLDGTARVWEAVADPPETPALRHKDPVIAVSFDRTGRRVLTGSYDFSARVWDAANGSQLSSKLLHTADIYSAEFSPDGRKVVTSSGDNKAVIWDWRSGKPTAPMLLHGGYVHSAVFSPDGGRILTASADGFVRGWDARTGFPAIPPMRNEHGLFQAAFAPDGRYVATAGTDGTRIWDSETGKLVGVPLPYTKESSVLGVAFSPDGRLIVTASNDSTARIWNAQTCLPESSPLKHAGAVEYAEFDPEGRRVVTASLDKTAGIWDVATGKLLRALPHNGEVYRASFSSDGRRVLTCAFDGTARIWSADDGQMLGAPMLHASVVMSCAFSRDGRRAITGSARPDLRMPPLPSEYVAPANSAQIWHAPPWPTPDTTPSLALRRRADRALENLAMVLMAPLIPVAILAVLFSALVVITALRKRIQRLAEAKGRAR